MQNILLFELQPDQSFWFSLNFFEKKLRVLVLDIITTDVIVTSAFYRP